MFKSNQANDINIVKSLFKFNIPLELSNQEIDKENFQFQEVIVMKIWKLYAKKLVMMI